MVADEVVHRDDRISNLVGPRTRTVDQGRLRMLLYISDSVEQALAELRNGDTPLFAHFLENGLQVEDQLSDLTARNQSGRIVNVFHRGINARSREGFRKLHPAKP